jgi:hypothetical protein
MSLLQTLPETKPLPVESTPAVLAIVLRSPAITTTMDKPKLP